MLKDSELRAAQLETEIARLCNDNHNQEVLEERMDSRLSESNATISIDEAFIKGGVE